MTTNYIIPPYLLRDYDVEARIVRNDSGLRFDSSCSAEEHVVSPDGKPRYNNCPEKPAYLCISNTDDYASEWGIHVFCEQHYAALKAATPD